jgi:asparagine synthase (glutamine-hydrolysing)
MCGIAGVFNLDGRPVERRLLEAMAAVQRHRGPDGEGLHLDGPVGLAHRRLAILDLEGGDQPMTTADGAAWIVFNGEIYNYVELRDELAARGHPLTTRSDTEVILHLYEEKGADCVRDLRGMFAFALWDPRRRLLLLARDRVGIKPLYYANAGGFVAFASELKGLLAHPGVRREPDRVALNEFMTLLYVPGPRTCFEGILKLPPAHTLTVTAEGAELRRYWALPEGTEERPEGAWREELEATLREAVRIHMRSDVPVGALLSGGIDSSLVVALASDAAGGPVRTFSVGFSEADMSELPYARQVAERYRTSHTEYVLEARKVADVPSLVAHFDEPFGDSSSIPCSHIAEVASRDVKVCLSGDGGDEAFAGYDAYPLARTLSRADLVPLAARRLLLGPIERLVPEWARGKGLLRFLTLPPADRYAEIMGSVDVSTRRWLLTPEFREATAEHHPYERIRALHAAHAGCDEVARLQRVDLDSYLPDDILVKSDRTSMLHSLELRVPLLDHKVLELAFRMPTPLKLRNGRSKWILRETFADRLPEAIRRRGKQGFGIPLSAWLRGDLQGWAREVFSDPRTRRRGVLDPAGLDRLLASHLRGARDLSNEIWSALVLELWFRERIDPPLLRRAGGQA